MRYYQEITLLPNPDINVNFLWSKVFQQLHLGFVEAQIGENQCPVGVSFPEYKMGDKFGVLGRKCRLFAPDEVTLEHFAIPQRLSKLCDYVHYTSIREVTPEKIKGYAVYRRMRVKSNPERLARRYAKRHGLDLATALSTTVELRKPTDNTSYLTSFRYCDMKTRTVNLPFIRLQSLSGGQTFCLWVSKATANHAKGGYFSSYGLSQETTVPEF